MVKPIHKTLWHEIRILGNPEIFYDIMYKWNVLSNYIKITTQIGADDSSTEIFWFRTQSKKRRKIFSLFWNMKLKASTYILFKEKTRAYKSWCCSHCWYFKHTIPNRWHIQIRVKGMQKKRRREKLTHKRGKKYRHRGRCKDLENRLGFSKINNSEAQKDQD